MKDKIWRLKTRSYQKKGDDWLLKILSQNRNLKTRKQLNDFLNPNLDQILKVEPTGIKGAITRIEKAIKNKEKIVVYSDYDADGISATAIMWETLTDLGADVAPYVPHRIKEGYGLSIEAITKHARDNVTLIITVDHGVTAVTQVEHAKKLGIDVIITDHHVLPKKLPKPDALVHTVNLCGAGVAWRLCWEIVKKLNPAYRKTLLEKLELAALATIADLVPMLGANRAIVKIGLEKIAQTKRPGIKALTRSAGINNSIGTYEIGHILAPRINAMGRIEHGLDSLRLLCARNQQQADSLATLLSKTNTRRQDLTTQAIEHATTKVDKQSLVSVVADHSWHEGVIGLVASRLVEVNHKPTVVISKGQLHSKGSARSIPGFNIIEAIRTASDLLVDAGGHPMAAGFTIETKHIETFTHKINVYASTKLTEEHFTPVIDIECQLDKENISKVSLETVRLFEPFGMANPQPLFLTTNLAVEDVRTVGFANKHLKLQVDGVNAIGFNQGQLAALIRPGYLVDIVYTLTLDRYKQSLRSSPAAGLNGTNTLLLKIKDIRISPSRK